MRRCFVPSLVACLFFLMSCQQKETDTRTTIPYVRSILSNPSSPEMMVISAYPGRQRLASICVVGDSVSAKACEKSLASCDIYDNVNGVLSSDRLPDFAGETVYVIADEANAPYSDFVSGNRGEELRAVVVNQAVQALDTVSHLSIYDVEGLGRKLPAKIIVLSSPYAAAYGMYDVDSLFSAASCDVSVVSPLVAVFDRAFDSSCFNLAVISDQGSLSDGVHEKFFLDEVSSKKIVGAKAFFFAPSEFEGEDVITSMMDAYISKGGSEPIEAVLVDNPSVDPEKVREKLSRMTDVMNEESVLYSHVISPSVKVFDSNEELRRSCFGILRENNLFTHYISFPKLKDYRRLFNPAGVGTVVVDN